MLYSPKWSKAKKRLSDFLCETLRSRVDFQVINYRKAHDQLDRAIITVDNVEILSMCTITAAREEFYRESDIRDQSNRMTLAVKKTAIKHCFIKHIKK
ncbi:SF0329 family protein [Peribacillus butanolivorans]|uniref:SF0329 family protein n=1 Tax=Peribacillus butanolivorans TaxID=421767 RepID=UPI004062D5C6